MKQSEGELSRLLRSAASDTETSPAEAPFGFETRVVALWRAANGERSDRSDLTRFVRWVGVVAFAVMIAASAGAYREFTASDQENTSVTNEYAIADTAIQTEISQ